MEDVRPLLHVCVTCRANRQLAVGEPPPGRLLFDALARHMERAGAPLRLCEITCLASCEQGCAAAISMPGKWSYLLGRLDAKQAADLIAYGGAYAASENGTVWRSGRADSLRDAILARVPGHGFAHQERA